MLKTSSEITAAASLQRAADSEDTSDARYYRALDLHQAGLFESVAQAQTYLDLLARCQRGEQLDSDARRFVEESSALEKQLQQFREARSAALRREEQVTQARQRRTRLEHELEVERARLAALPSEPLRGAYLDYRRYLGEASYNVGARMGPALEAFNVKLYRKFLEDIVIPDLENQIRVADADMSKLTPSAVPPSA